MGQVDETNFKNIYQDVEKVDYSYGDVNSGEFNHQWSNDDIYLLRNKLFRKNDKYIEK